MKILDFWYFDEFKTENPARTAKSSVQRRKKRPESGINATQKEAAGNPTDSYFTIKRKKYQVFIRAIFIFFRKIILIFRACRKAPRQVNSRLILGFPFGEALPRSGGGEVPLGFPLRAFLAELPFQGSFGSLAVRAAD